ncbi:MAG: serine/threonine protein kinase [Eubacterium sp.]|nr:serine/threonine protein kinase [Eubacterium sp.]
MCEKCGKKNYENDYKYSSNANLEEGSVLNNKYELLKKISRGGLSTIYLVRDIRLNKMWAVKDKNNTQSNPIFNSAIQEVKMMKSFNHSAIPNVVDIIAQQNYVAIVMDYVEGETLESIVKEYGAQPVEKVVEWIKQICDVLSYLHNLNPPHIYRDMKPSNVILQPNGSIKIVDFGLIRTYKQNQLEDTCYLGTKGYAAPEQYGRRGQSDARTDIYGLGMTMYHLLTGLDPKEFGFSVKPICQVNPSLPKGLEYIVEKCTQLDPANRYQSCVELQNDLDRYEQIPPKKSFFDKIFKH